MTTRTKQKSISPAITSVGDGALESKPIFTIVAEVQSNASPLAWLTLEVMASVLLFVLALSLRLWHLDDYPLSNAEAGQTLVAWQLYRGIAFEGASYSPLLVTLNGLAFFLMGPSDFSARLASVLLGSALVLLPLTFRRQLGPTVCLLTMALLALSPTATFLSRVVNSEVGVATGALMLVSALFNWAADGRQRWLWLGAAGGAILLTAGPLAYSTLLIFAIIIAVRFAHIKMLWGKGFQLAQISAGAVHPVETAEGEETAPLPTKAQAAAPAGRWRSPAALLYFFLFSLVLLATAATFNLGGLSAVSGLLSEWLSRFGPLNRPEASFNAVFLLTIYEPMLVLLGLAGLAYAILDRDLLKEILGGWFIGTLILDIVMGGRPIGSSILPLAPLVFLAALALAELWSGLQQEGSWGNEGLLLAAGLVIGTFAYIGLTAWLIRTCGPEDNVCQYGWVQPVAALTLFIVIVVFFWFMTNPNVATRGAALAGVALGLLFTISISWRLNYGPLMDLAYQPLAGIPASTELIDLTNTLSRESAARAGGQLTALDTTLVNLNSPALLWRLRDFTSLAQVTSLVGAQPTQAIITSTNTELGLGQPYLGQSFALDAVWSPVGLPAKELCKWLIFRHIETRPQGNQAVLWLQLEQ